VRGATGRRGNQANLIHATPPYLALTRQRRKAPRGHSRPRNHRLPDTLFSIHGTRIRLSRPSVGETLTRSATTARWTGHSRCDFSGLGSRGLSKPSGRKTWGRKMPPIHAGGIFLPPFFCHRIGEGFLRPLDSTPDHSASPNSCLPADAVASSRPGWERSHSSQVACSEQRPRLAAALRRLEFELRVRRRRDRAPDLRPPGGSPSSSVGEECFRSPAGRR
jgi:hypothetical protein